jgi:hypothetical protein
LLQDAGGSCGEGSNKTAGFSRLTFHLGILLDLRLLFFETRLVFSYKGA